tara:strand:- start:12375 stop:12980 length:606 start_codon:yes stop_codon:yes gene_type:complete
MNYCNNISPIRKRKDKKKPCLFLDRDGVIIEDKHYLSCPSEVNLITGSSETISKFKDKGWLIVIITNQSGIDRKILSWSDYHKVTKKMINLLGKKSLPNAIYANSDLPGSETNVNSWRKPSPQMILIAESDYQIDLSKSILVGDRLSDIECAYNAGLKIAYHVLTGHGNKERNLIHNDWLSNKFNELSISYIDTISQLSIE